MSVSSTVSAWRRWRVRVFAGTWIAYAGYYLCRKNLPIVQPVLMEQFGWSKEQVGLVATVFLFTYALGQFFSGAMGDRLGVRAMLTLGIAATVLLNVLSGVAASLAVLTILWGLNGLAQATGWPVTVRTMSRWFRREERGRIMGWWCTNYQFGDVMGTWLAAGVLGAGLGWRWTFWLPAAVLLVLAVPIFRWARNRPEDVGLPPLERVDMPEASVRWSDVRGVFSTFALWGLGLINALLKFVLYVLFFWAPTYLVDGRGYAPEMAGFLAAFFALGGVLGVVVVGWASDRFFSARRMPAVAFSLCLLIVGVAALPFAPNRAWMLGALLALAGCATFGPEALISGAAAVEFAPQEGTATAVGLVNGVASLAGVPAGVLGAWIVASFGWPALFFALAGAAVAALAVSLLMWNAQGAH